LDYFVYIGTYTGSGSQGIYGYRFDAITGDFERIGLAAEAENPSFLAVHPHGRFLYAVNEIADFEGQSSGSVSAFAIDPHSGELKLSGKIASLGAMPAYVSLDRRGRYALVANYQGGSVAVFPVAESGGLLAPSAFVDHTEASRKAGSQKSSHAHAIRVAKDNKFAIAADLGLDQLLVYRFDETRGLLSPHQPAAAELKPGAGPRHLSFHPNGKWLYVANEFDSTVTAFSYHAEAGALRHLETMSTLPPGFAGRNSPAEILVDQKGGFLYVSNRGHDSIAVFAIDSGSGRLTAIEQVPTGGRTPRNFALDPTGNWMFAANQDSNQVVLFALNQDRGRLTPSLNTLPVGSPVCIAFAPAV
jgi:6-phosphogluconolactonase